MSYTKYVMREDDVFAIISKMTGVEHATLATITIGANRISSAGFLYLNPDGKIDAYGKSHSTGKSSDEADGPVILAAINRGEVVIVENAEACIFYATNHPSVRAAGGSKPATMADLQHHRIFEND